MKFTSLVDALLKIAAEEPERPFIHLFAGGASTAVSYGQLREDSLAAAEGLRAAGVGKDAQVAIMLPHTASQFAIYLGAMMLGAQPSFHTPFNIKSDPVLYWPSQAKLLNAISPAVVVTDTAGCTLIAENLPELTFKVVDESALLAGGKISTAEIIVSEFALVQYSSGTTGLRKAVQLTHAAIIEQAEGYAAAIELAPGDRIASWLPMYHDMGLMTSFIMPLINRTPVAAMSPFEWVARPDSLLTLISTFKATLCWLPNFAYAHIARMKPADQSFDLSTIRAIINCSEPCRASTFQDFTKAFASFGLRENALQTCYAMAETVFAVTQSPIGQPWKRLGELGGNVGGEDILGSGLPISGIELRIVDEDGRALPEQNVGEIHIRSSMCIERYRGAPMPAIDSEGWYRTGDIGIFSEGELFVIGRKDDVIVTRGKKIFAHEVEKSLAGIEGLKAGRACVLGVDSAEAGTLELVVVCELEQVADRKHVRRAISRTIEYGFAVAPSAIHFVEPGWVVKSSSGKIARYANRKKLLDMLQSE